MTGMAFTQWVKSKLASAPVKILALRLLCFLAAILSAEFRFNHDGHGYQALAEKQWDYVVHKQCR